MTRPIYGLTVLRYEDGRTEVTGALERYDGQDWVVGMPSDWRLRHAMLIDALAEVKREAPAGHIVDGFLSELGCTVRDCLGCGALIAGGPTRCKRCARESEPSGNPGGLEREAGE